MKNVHMSWDSYTNWFKTLREKRASTQDVIIFLVSYTDLAIEPFFHIAEKESGPLKDNIAITQSKKAGLSRLEFQNPF